MISTLVFNGSTNHNIIGMDRTNKMEVDQKKNEIPDDITIIWVNIV